MRGHAADWSLSRENGAVNRDYDVVVPAPFGAIAVHCEASAIVALDLLGRPAPATPAGCGFAARVMAQIQGYLRNGRLSLTLPVRFRGTAFQRRVWERLRQLPPGGVCTYGMLAKELRTSARAIGGACRANPVPLVIPCHRVVAAGGLGGFSGFREGRMLAIKGWLLEHEQSSGG